MNNIPILHTHPPNRDPRPTVLTDADGNWIYSIRVGGYGEGGPWDDALAALALAGTLALCEGVRRTPARRLFGARTTPVY